MSNVQKFQGIPIILSGEKYLTSEGFFAIKNGVKRKKIFISKKEIKNLNQAGLKQNFLRVRHIKM